VANADGDDGLVALGAFIREQRRQAHLSMRKLAEQAGVSNPYLSQIERGLRKPSADILQQLARALSLSAEALYVQAGILEHRSGDVDVIGEIMRDPSITPDQRQALVRTYRAFQAEASAARAGGGESSAGVQR
jgi:transcriptional regulator with XRE-family HTH domain